MRDTRMAGMSRRRAFARRSGRESQVLDGIILGEGWSWKGGDVFAWNHVGVVGLYPALEFSSDSAGNPLVAGVTYNLHVKLSGYKAQPGRTAKILIRFGYGTANNHTFTTASTTGVEQVLTKDFVMGPDNGRLRFIINDKNGVHTVYISSIYLEKAGTS